MVDTISDFWHICKASNICGYSSVVERHLAKVNVARSNRVTRFQGFI
jgi:hypothetical protein